MKKRKRTKKQKNILTFSILIVIGLIALTFVFSNAGLSYKGIAVGEGGNALVFKYDTFGKFFSEFFKPKGITGIYIPDRVNVDSSTMMTVTVDAKWRYPAIKTAFTVKFKDEQGTILGYSDTRYYEQEIKASGEWYKIEFSKGGGVRIPDEMKTMCGKKVFIVIEQYDIDITGKSVFDEEYFNSGTKSFILDCAKNPCEEKWLLNDVKCENYGSANSIWLAKKQRGDCDITDYYAYKYCGAGTRCGGNDLECEQVEIDPDFCKNGKVEVPYKNTQTGECKILNTLCPPANYVKVTSCETPKCVIPEGCPTLECPKAQPECKGVECVNGKWKCPSTLPVEECFKNSDCEGNELCNENNKCYLPEDGEDGDKKECDENKYCIKTYGKDFMCYKGDCVEKEDGDGGDIYCKVYEEATLDGDCVFSFEKLFKGDGFNEFFKDNSFMIMLIFVLIILIVVAFKIKS